MRRVALGSLAADRARVLALFPDHPEGLTVETCAKGIGKGESRARAAGRWAAKALVVAVGLRPDRMSIYSNIKI